MLTWESFKLGTMVHILWNHDDVIKWKHFPRNWPFVRGIHRSPLNSPHKGQWRRALMFSLICIWINNWVNNHEAGDLRRYHAHYDVIVMYCSIRSQCVNFENLMQERLTVNQWCFISESCHIKSNNDQHCFWKSVQCFKHYEINGCYEVVVNFNGSVQDCDISIGNALEIP